MIYVECKCPKTPEKYGTITSLSTRGHQSFQTIELYFKLKVPGNRYRFMKILGILLFFLYTIK